MSPDFAYPVLRIGELPDLLAEARAQELNPRKIEGVEELRYFLGSLLGLRRAPVIVLYDLAQWSPQALATLLKFLEESRLRVIALASDDVISGALLSRFATIDKRAEPLVPRGDDPRFFMHRHELPLQQSVGTHAPGLLAAHRRLGQAKLVRKDSIWSLWVRGICNG